MGFPARSELSPVCFPVGKTLQRRQNHSPHPQWSHACLCHAPSLQRSRSPCPPTHIGCVRLGGSPSQDNLIGCGAACGVGAAFCRLSVPCEAPSLVLSQALCYPSRFHHLHARQTVPLLPCLSAPPPLPMRPAIAHIPRLDTLPSPYRPRIFPAPATARNRMHT